MNTCSNLNMMQTNSSHHEQYPANHDDGFSLPSNKNSSSVTNSISAYKYPWMRPEFTSASVHKCRRSSGYTCYQLHELENEFRMNRYLTCVKRTELSQRIGLTERQIKIWFQAHRLQWKRERCKSLITFYVQPEANTTNHDQNHQSSAISTNYTAA